MKILKYLKYRSIKQYLLPLFLTLFICAVTILLLNYKSTPQAPKFKSKLGSSSYLASNRTYSADINTESGAPQIRFSRGNSGIAFTLSAAQLTESKKTNGNTLTFPNIQNDTDLVYTTTPNGLKEELILHSPPATNTFLFDLKLNNASSKNLFNNYYDSTFYDPDGRYLFHFEKPFAIDALGNRTDNVILNITQDQQMPGFYSLKLIVDPTWLTDPARSYPISIDPTIVHDTTAEFAAGFFDHVKDTGSGSSPILETYYQELPRDEYTVGLWHMNESADNSCSGGQDVCDISGNANHGTFVGNAAFSSTAILGAKSTTYDGTGDYTTIASQISFADTKNFTVELWYKGTDTAQNTDHGKALVGRNNSDLYANLVLRSGYVEYVHYNGAWTHNIKSTTLVADGNWHHIAYINYANETGDLYIDGKPEIIGLSSSISNDTYPFRIDGFMRGYNNVETSGNIDEVRVSNIARSPEQIKASASRRPSAVYTSDVIDLTNASTWTNFSWTELGVTTGNGETLKSSTNLVAQWNFNETSGTTADNAEGTASLDGTLTNFASTSSQDQAAGTGWTSANKRWGAGALMFDGINDYVSVTDNLNLGNGNFSIETWYKPNSSSGRLFSKRDGDSTNIEWEIYLSNFTPGFAIYNSAGTLYNVTTSNVTPEVGKWSHLVAIHDATNSVLKIYVNGALAGTVAKTQTITDSSSPIRIGARHSTPEAFFSGAIDSTRIYSRALTADEIMSNYQAGNIEFQTRVGADTSPDDGSWEAWKTSSSETVIDNMDNPLDYATPSASVFVGAQIATSSATLPAYEGTKSLKIQSGRQNSLTSVVALWHLDETGGTGAYLKDSTSNANHGTPTGTSVTQGISGKGRNFVTNSDYLTAGNIADNLSNFTVSAWIKTTNNNVNTIVSKINQTTTYPGWALYTDSTPRIHLAVQTDNNNYRYGYWSGTYADGKWHHVAATKDASNNIIVYVDGVSSTSLLSAGTLGSFSNALNLTIGEDGNHTASKNMVGSIDEVRISNVVRTAEEIIEEYRAGRDHYINKTISSTDLSGKTSLPFYIAADRPGTYLSAIVGESLFANYQPDANTRGFWHLDEHAGSGSYLKDISGLGNHLTPTVATSIQGKIGRGMVFNGSSAYLSCTDANCGGTTKLDPISTNGWSFGAWVNPSSFPGTAPVIFAKVGNNSGYTLLVNTSGQIRAEMGNSACNNDSGYGYQTNATLPTNTWSHVVVTVTASNPGILRLYVNGELKYTSAQTAYYCDQSGNFYIGSNGTAGYYWSGQIDTPFISASQLSTDEIRQAYESGLRTHPITIDFASAISHSNPLSSSADLTFTLMATPSGTTNAGDNIFKGDKIIVRENYDGTEYLAQGTVDSVNVSSGATTVSAWDASSTFPSVGFGPNSTVFKWQREYWPIDGKALDSHLDAITNLTLRMTDGSEGRTIYFDDLKSNSGYLTTPAGSTITSSTGNRYFQYRAILTSTDESVTPSLSNVSLDYIQNSTSNTPSLDAPSDTATNRSLLPVLQTTGTDTDSDYLRYKIELCTNVGMTTGCQTFDQTSSQTGWSGQDTQSTTAYTSGTQASYTLQSNLTPATTYYWRSYAIDPAGSNSWSSTQTPYSFTTTDSPSSPTTPYSEGVSNPTNVIDSTPELSAIHSDPNSDNAIYYEIEVNTANDFTGTVMWDSGSVSMSNLASGQRSTDVSYAGTTLTSATTYYWRIRFTDSNGATSDWSTTQNFTMGAFPNTPTLDSPSDYATEQILLPVLQSTGTDPDSDYLRYKIELCTNVGMTTGCQTFDQTSSQTGWSGQDTQSTTAYTSGTQASYTLQSNLTPATTYYWRSYAIDPAGSNSWSSTQTPYSFTTISAPLSVAQCRIRETVDDSQLSIIWTDVATNEDYYEIQKSTNGGSWSVLATTLAANTSSYLDSSITQSNTYRYRIAPYFSTGPSYGDWCYTDTLSISKGNFLMQGLNFMGIKLN